MAGLDPFGLLVEELKSDEIQDQLAAAKRLNTIALNMGPDRCRSQLLPFLRLGVDEYTDEILMAIAEGAGNLVPAVGGGDYAHLLLPLLEALAEKEETLVRAKAVDSVVTVGKAMPPSTIQAELAPLVKRLAGAEFFPSKISAAGLFASIYPTTSPAQRSALRKLFDGLAKDEMPMVRSAAFAHMPALAAVVEKDVLMTEISPLFNELASDLQESVREMALENMVKMVKRLTPEEAVQIFGKFFDGLAAERCSSMRVHKATHFVELVGALHPVRNIRDQVPLYVALLANDGETEVRNAAAKNLGTFCAKLDKATILSGILPVLRELTQPPAGQTAQASFAQNQLVREHIAEHLSSLAPILERDSTIKEILPLIKVFLADDLIEIKRKALASLGPVVETLGPEQTEALLLPDVIRMSEDPQWRVRLSVVETLPVYATHLGMDMFNNLMREIQIRALGDGVAHIRERAVQNLERLSAVFGAHGAQWTEEQLLPCILDAAKNSGPSGYLGRITALQAAARLADVLPARVTTEVLVPQVVVPLSQDPVANVRIAAAQALRRISSCLSGEQRAFVNTTIRPMLQDLAKDSDPDVKYLCESAN
uniref:Phosphatase PP2A regulatory subunit A/Splicing factor 3B subunit 1-like HEAT repeat domain-containing protein n=1 Tax=Cryptomonas curvata TaxID=233186 RepID=A0A6T8EM82_9CRYP|mmetsp:Transcript_824/g.1761  ORF Transcript_824/g.1761 Transcript_824/m.1761 type:complete len:597 (+) Transcript_824:233-2023(+)